MDFQRLKEILPKYPLHWTQEDVLKWLEFIGLEKHASEFSKNRKLIGKNVGGGEWE